MRSQLTKQAAIAVIVLTLLGAVILILGGCKPAGSSPSESPHPLQTGRQRPATTPRPMYTVIR